MSLEIKVPTVGESITEVTIATWNKKDGDVVKLDEVLCELESDKATFELNSPAEGVLRIVAQAGETLPIGALIAKLENVGASAAAGAAAPAETPAAAAPAAAAAKTIEMKVPAVGESIAEVTVGTWSKKDGDFVNQDEVICEIESDKATFELNAEASGVLRIVAQSGTTLAIGDVICRIEGAGASVAAPAATPSAPAAAAGSAASSSYASGHASPAAGKILAEKGMEAAQVIGSGVGGRITKEDALKATPAPTKPAAAPAAAAPAQVTSGAFGGSRNQRRQKLTPLRKTVSRRLVAVKNETAMLTTFNEVDMKPIMDLRNKYKDKFKEVHSVGLGFMSFFTKACAVALKEFPAVNAYIDGDEIVYNDFADISIAVSAPKGLVVPVIRNAEDMSFAQLEKEVVRLATRARDNKLTIEEMTGGTFTITNGGIFGSMLSTPIINSPQSAILGMHNIVERPVAVGGQVVIRPIMYVALSYDHRIIDGRESVGFLVRVKQLLEDPTRLLLEV
ncbi:2-oxoglutarate dehydrogenase E2 component (dihydrolipoamide succinyltransferase) [Flexibacter flexilis DSM 6793]|uniref:Dihydrolipoyllysine-residue succinyltransferase component of 2-oxoglutarate dehydrogenase complex n=1 Tax=Flexibacter flexilis DSM 6793 TaxID=927664 RepID=A0A1I1K0X3_9BACT|nr:2-oxoglutarate dehydrogenase complex dihydrolipoyllysine-residue succinyltransferase [Flexibacter flexilis]SFC53862.1 2-oxoglutarate dehydrogenase E2 component (dihydrolipoamide succinyltransferase) [Flexibacter flexilis DSM 6793]